jgi:demethylmenaquinone methyltransferase / 2-methoxy-6-polyprenyl-1,4-benzoquinol methylase
LPFPDKMFDCITIGFGIRNLTFENPNALKHIQEIYRVLKSNGKLIILESGVPSNRFINFFYKLYLKSILIPIGGLISGNWKAYRYLAHSSANFFNFGFLQNMLEKEEFALYEQQKFLFGATNILVFVKK